LGGYDVVAAPDALMIVIGVAGVTTEGVAGGARLLAAFVPFAEETVGHLRQENNGICYAGNNEPMLPEPPREYLLFLTGAPVTGGANMCV
jgi:hypothetical protein